MKTKLLKVFSAMLALLMIMSISGFAAEPELTVKVDGIAVDFPDQKPVIVNDRTLVPVRFIAEALGHDVGWNQADSSAVIDNGSIVLYVGTNQARINGEYITLDVESQLINGRTMVPLRVVAETLNCTVDWIGAERTVLINRTSTVPSTFSIHFIDVGQADAALVECDGHYMLIDGGNKADSNTIFSVLNSAKVPKLDIIVGTHAHEDHIGGIPGAINYSLADTILCPVTSYDSDAFNDFRRYANVSGGITVPSVGDTYSLGSATVDILGVNGDTDTNNTSIVLMISYGSTSFLFAGDAEREAEQVILDSGADLSADLLKVGHHGSDSSTTYPFLREVMPKYAVISVGDGNTYGHPTDDTLSRLRDADVTVYRTDMQGDIYCTSDGSNITLTVARNASADTLSNTTSAGGTYWHEYESPIIYEPKDDYSSDYDDYEDEDFTPDYTERETSYILNTNTKKFHHSDCSSVKQMSDKNKDYYTGTRSELIAMGYDPCGKCNP